MTNLTGIPLSRSLRRDCIFAANCLMSTEYAEDIISNGRGVQVLRQAVQRQKVCARIVRVMEGLVKSDTDKQY